jgi:hypothetical protein
MKRRIFTKDQLFDPIIASPAYSINEYSYRIKLNQRVHSALQYRSNNYDYKRTYKGVKRDETPMQQPLPEIVEKHPNRPCYPPIVAIRRWLYFIAPTDTKYGFKRPCEACKKEKQKGTNRSALLKLWTKK